MGKSDWELSQGKELEQNKDAMSEFSQKKTGKTGKPEFFCVVFLKSFWVEKNILYIFFRPTKLEGYKNEKQQHDIYFSLLLIP